MLTFLGSLAYGGTETWDDWFMPGGGYKIFTPKNKDLGIYQGFVTEFVTYARSVKKDTSTTKKWNSGGPTRLKTFMNLSIMKSDVATSKDIFYWNCGASVTFEAARKRNYLLPFFGIQTGTLYQRDFGTFHLTPEVGLYLFANERCMWTVYGGHQYTTHEFDEWSGLNAGTSFNFLLWN